MSSGEKLDGEGESSGEELEENQVSDEPKGKISEYEKQRLSRIAENRARLDSLGISKAAKELLNSSPKRTRKRKSSDDDDYRPGEAADGDEEEEEIDSECDDEDQEFLENSRSASRKRKNKTSASKRRVLTKKNVNRSDSFGEDDSDDDLNKAIALSLQAGGSSSKKKKPVLMSKMQMTEDELVIYFYQFDEAGKGFITLRDLAKMANVHDFTWTPEELQDMIRCFDLDKDGKLSLDEFNKIVTRCRMLKEP